MDWVSLVEQLAVVACLLISYVLVLGRVNGKEDVEVARLREYQ